MESDSGKILIIDLGSDVRDLIGLVANGLSRKGIQVVRPAHRKELAEHVRLASDGYFDPPRLVVHFDLEIPNAFSNLIKLYEFLDIKVINPYFNSAAVYNRIGLAALLRKNGVNYPNFYFGDPRAIPESFGKFVLKKDVEGHLVQVVSQDKVHSSSELAYYEKILKNPTGETITVYWIFGKTFAVSKPDISSGNGRKL